MSLHDFFRKAFGITSFDRDSGRPGFRNPIWDEEADDDDDELDDDFRYAPNSPFGFRVFSGDPMDIHKYFEQQMDELLKNFQSSFFGSDKLLEIPDPYHQDKHQEEITDREAVRNRYLKPSFEKSIQDGSPKRDTDIDDRVTVGDLRKFFPNSEEDASPSTSVVPNKVYGQSVITRIIRRPDGSVERQQKVTGIDGKEEITVTREIGDQKYRVITKKDNQTGQVDTTEELVNLDEEKLPEFNQRWEDTKRSSKHSLDHPSNHNLVPFVDREDTILRLFEKWFK